MYEAKISQLNVSIKFPDETFDVLEEKKIMDINTNNDLFVGKIIEIEEGVIMIISKEKFKKV